jgi:predicted nucleic acid-binding protein
MVLVDTSVWVHHLRYGNASLDAFLKEGRVICHPFVIGELACGSMENRSEILSLISSLPQSVLADHEEVLEFLENNRLYGLGIGWIDQHLLASALLSGAQLWTLDTRLSSIASRFGLSP